MRKRDRLQNRFHALFAPGATSSASSHINPPPSAQRTSSSPSPAPVPAPTTLRNTVLEKAITIHLTKIPEAEKAAFARASKSLDEQTLISNVRAYDVAHKDNSSFRPHAERLEKFLNVLNRFMGGVAIGIQASPEISSLVVGAVRIVVDLALTFTIFFNKLTDMICTFEDYLGPLAVYARAADIELVEKAVVNIYVNILDFGWKARNVFIDKNGDQRRWSSFRMFMRQQWETFDSEFVSIKENMQHHLDVLLHSVQALHFDTSRRGEQSRLRDEEKKERSAFLSWMSNIDFEETHQGIYAKKHAQTGDWLINEPKFQQWFQSPDSSLLWCHGKPGIGKSVLASNVVEHITTEAGLREDTAICFAYYNYRDTQLANIMRIVAALMKQLCRRRDRIPPGLLQIKHDALSPSSVGTQERFLSLIEDLYQVYVVFDALDECPEQNREDALSFITSIVTAQIPCRVKVFITSRREMDIAKAFEDKHIPIVQIRAKNVAADIETFARSQVEKLRAGEHGKALYVTSDDLKERIVQVLAKKADGMFLWVNLQLDNLCQVSKARKDQLVEDALETLPQGLPETYNRILERIEGQPSYMKELALNCLAWMIYAQRSLSTEELQDALATDLKCTIREDLQLDPPEVILEACGNLLEEANGFIRPIHYTVQEFLTTAAQEPSLGVIRTLLRDSNSMHTRLSVVCLRYIRMVAFNSPALEAYDLHDRLEDNVFIGYACHSFDYHISKCDEVSPEIMEQLENVFQQGDQSLAATLQIRVLRDGFSWSSTKRHFDAMHFLVSASTIVYSTSLYSIPAVRQRWVDHTPPMYALHLASSAGLVSAVVRLLDSGCDVNEGDGNDCTPLYHACFENHLDIVQTLLGECANVNTQGGYYGNALQAASHKGYKETVTLLLDKNADVNAQGGYYGNALQAASYGGHKETVTLLLNNFADINAQGGLYGNALQAASYGGHKETVTLLLNNFADINAQGGLYGNALQAASAIGHKEIVTLLLLNKNADINVQGGYYGNALQAASAEGHKEIVTLLLDKNADVNAQGGHYGNALQAASAEGYKEIVTLLLNKNANVNAQGGYYGNALQAASYEGNKEIVTLLLDKNADVNAQDGREYENALQAASGEGHKEIVTLLIDKNADVNAQGGQYGNALQAASAKGYKEIVTLLLDKNADVNAQGGVYGNALHAASAFGHKEIVTLLLNKNANVNAQGGHYGNALQAASYRGHKEIVTLLLDKNADVNAQGGVYGNALQAASAFGHKEIVTLLLNKNANVNAQGGHYGNALQSASAFSHKEIVTLLLDKNANVNEQGGHYGNALQSASAKGHKEIVTLLLNKNANVNAQGGHYGNALQAASGEGHKEIVTLLLDKNANVNEQGGHYGNALQSASAFGHKEIVTLLLDKNADVNAQGGREYENALQAASAKGHKEIVTLLLDKNADVNAQGGEYGNALQAASYRGYKEIVTLLLDKGALRIPDISSAEVSDISDDEDSD